MRPRRQPARGDRRADDRGRALRTAGRFRESAAFLSRESGRVSVLPADLTLASQVLNVSSMTWQTSYHANTIFSTPDIVAKIAGGIGTGFSSSGSGSTTGGTGADDPDTSSSGQNGSGSGSPGASGHSGGSGGADKGAIAGGVVGGVLGALVLAALLYLVARRRRREKEAAAEGEKRKVGAAGGLLGNRTHSGSSGDGDHFSHEKHS